jgi:hypothetical protein
VTWRGVRDVCLRFVFWQASLAVTISNSRLWLRSVLESFTGGSSSGVASTAGAASSSSPQGSSVSDGGAGGADAPSGGSSRPAQSLWRRALTSADRAVDGVMRWLEGEVDGVARRLYLSPENTVLLAAILGLTAAVYVRGVRQAQVRAVHRRREALVQTKLWLQQRVQEQQLREQSQRAQQQQ